MYAIITESVTEYLCVLSRFCFHFFPCYHTIHSKAPLCILVCASRCLPFELFMYGNRIQQTSDLKWSWAIGPKDREKRKCMNISEMKNSWSRETGLAKGACMKFQHLFCMGNFVQRKCLPANAEGKNRLCYTIKVKQKQ